MFKVKHKETGKIYTVYTIFNTGVDWVLLFKHGRWYSDRLEYYVPYESLSDKFKVGEYYEYLAGHGSRDFMKIVSIKGDFAVVYSSIIDDNLIVELNDLVLNE